MDIEEIVEEEKLIFDKTMECPICDKKFTTKQVRTGKARYLGTDDDLRPIYSKIDTIKYDVCLCPYCGYGSVLRDFENVTSKQRINLKEKIASRYSAEIFDAGVYSYDVAIRRYKMALLTAMTKPAKLSERAYLCLKLSWLYRGKKEELQKEMPDGYESKIEKCNQSEELYSKQAYQGFSEAVATEYPPICGMDETTVSYLMAVLGKKCGDYDNAAKYAYSVISSKSVSLKTKEKARELVSEIKETIDSNSN